MMEWQADVQRLLDWEAQARRLVEEGTARATAIRQDADRRRRERLKSAAKQAADAAAAARARILAGVEEQCRTIRAEAERDAGRIRTEAKPRTDAAVEAALRWLFEEGEGRAGGR